MNEHINSHVLYFDSIYRFMVNKVTCNNCAVLFVTLQVTGPMD